MTGIERSGDIGQQGNGTAVAHTGIGDIRVQIANATFNVNPAALSAAAGGPSPASVRRTLPRDIPQFTGRSAELQALLKAMEDGAQTGKPVLICAIDGMAGVGKTALAVHAAHRLASCFPDGQLFMRLHAHTPGKQPVEPAEALAALLRAVGMDPGSIPATLDERERLWRDGIAGKRILLLLDDAATHDQVEPLIPGVGGCAVLVTSRRRLTALAGVLPLELDILQPDQAIDLFTQVSDCHKTEAAAVTELVDLAGRLPLAIQMLGARLRSRRSWTVTDLASDLATARDRSEAIGATDEPVSAAFDLSYNTLPAHRQQFFRRLGLHPGTEIDAYAAAALTGLGLQQAGAGLDALFSIHLIEEPVRGRYRFHDLLGDYARALAATDIADGRDRALDHLLDYYLYTAQAAQRHLASDARSAVATGAAPRHAPMLSTSEQAATWMETELPNLRAVIDFAAHHRREHYAVGIPAAMQGFLRTHGPWDQAHTLHWTAVAAAQRNRDQLGEANALTDLGIVERLTDEYATASINLTKALQLYRRIGNRHGQATALAELGLVQQMTCEFVTAAASLSRALKLYRAVGNCLGEANALNYHGLVLQATASYAAAATCHEQALELYRGLGNRHGEATALNYLGSVQEARGQYAAAALSLSRALQLFRALGNRHGQANAFAELGNVQRLVGEYSAATSSLTQALELYHALGDQLGEANAHKSLGAVQQTVGDYAPASATLAEALRLYRALGNRHGQANALTELGDVQRLVGDYPAAAASLQQSLRLYRSLGDRHREAQSLISMGALAMASGNKTGALRWYEQALAMAHDVAVPLEEARALEGIGRCLLQSGQADQGRPFLRQALEIYQRIESPYAPPVEATLQHDHVN